MPDLFEHIDRLGVPYTMFSTKWFICLYIDVLPVEVGDIRENHFKQSLLTKSKVIP